MRKLRSKSKDRRTKKDFSYPKGWTLADSTTPTEDIIAQCPETFRLLED